MTKRDVLQSPTIITHFSFQFYFYLLYIEALLLDTYIFNILFLKKNFL